jgi:hypothetical protein
MLRLITALALLCLWTSGQTWTDTAGQFIVAHDGGISRFGNTWYWYGSDYSGNPKGDYGRRAHALANGFRVYGSRDLKRWKYEGVCLAVPPAGFGSQGTPHRPNVLYHARTRRYVMWFFEFVDKYPDAMLGVAVADRPVGPFRILGRRETGAPNGWAQDLGLFQDDDGQGYLVYDDGQRNLRVDLLTDDYTASTKQSVIALTAKHEGSAMFKMNGRYIVAGSGVKGWAGTDTHYAVADKPLGPYGGKRLLSEAGNETWGSQISNFFAGPRGEVFGLFDRWWIDAVGRQTKDLNASSYYFLRLRMDGDSFRLEPPAALH